MIRRRDRREGKRQECGGTRFLQKAGFPRTPSGKNSYMAGGIIGASVGPHGCALLLEVRGGRFCKNAFPGNSCLCGLRDLCGETLFDFRRF